MTKPSTAVFIFTAEVAAAGGYVFTVPWYTNLRHHHCRRRRRHRWINSITKICNALSHICSGKRERFDQMKLWGDRRFRLLFLFGATAVTATTTTTAAAAATGSSDYKRCIQALLLPPRVLICFYHANTNVRCWCCCCCAISRDTESHVSWSTVFFAVFVSSRSRRCRDWDFLIERSQLVFITAFFRVDIFISDGRAIFARTHFRHTLANC